MNYDSFCAARDLFYLAGVLAGSAAGLCAGGAFGFRPSVRVRSRDITAALYVLSAAIITAAAALCLDESIVYESWIFVGLGGFAAVFFVAFFFPVALRFALCVVVSVMALSTLYFYRIGTPFDPVRQRITRLEYLDSSTLVLKPEYNKVHVFSTAREAERGTRVFYDERYNDTVKYALCFIKAGRAAPVFGGARRLILLSLTVEQVEPGRQVQVFWTKPMEETLLGALLSKHTALLNSTDNTIFAPPGRGIIEMQVIYGRAKLPPPESGVKERTLVLQNQHDVWSESWINGRLP